MKPRDVLALYDNMLACSSRECRKKWFKHLLPYLIVLSGQDFIKEFGPGGLLSTIGWAAVSRMLSTKRDGCTVPDKSDGVISLICDLC